MSIDWSALRAPFPESEVKFRVQGKKSAKGWVRLVTYVDARAVEDRLDDVLGPDVWGDSYAAGPCGGVLCSITVRVGARIETVKTDGAENTQIEGVKGGLSDAFKRAAVKWGIGRYLYRLPTFRAKVQDGWGKEERRDINIQGGGYVSRPTLPSWALPSRSPGGTAAQQGYHKSYPEGMSPRVGENMKAFHAAYAKLHLPLDYEQLKLFLLWLGKPKPSVMEPVDRQKLLDWLPTATGNRKLSEWLDGPAETPDDKRWEDPGINKEEP